MQIVSSFVVIRCFSGLFFFLKVFFHVAILILRTIISKRFSCVILNPTLHQIPLTHFVWVFVLAVRHMHFSTLSLSVCKNKFLFLILISRIFLSFSADLLSTWLSLGRVMRTRVERHRRRRIEGNCAENAKLSAFTRPVGHIDTWSALA
jgi:hypothetical protein